MPALADEEAVSSAGDAFKGLFTPQLHLDKTTSQIR